MERLTSKREGEKVIRVHGKEQKKGKNTHWTERSERKKGQEGRKDLLDRKEKRKRR